MRTTVLECDTCGQKNRVDLDKHPENVVCGNCKEPLEEVILDFLALEADDESIDDADDILDDDDEDTEDEDDDDEDIYDIEPEYPDED